DASAIGISVAGKSQVIDFTDTNNATMGGLVSGTYTWVGKDSQYDFAGEDVAIHNAILAPDNDNARFYAVTAGAPVEIPRGAEEIRIRGLADAKRIGFGDTASLLNIRTTGVGASAAVALEDAAEVTYDSDGEGTMTTESVISTAGVPRRARCAVFERASGGTLQVQPLEQSG